MGRAAKIEVAPGNREKIKAVYCRIVVVLSRIADMGYGWFMG
jgi:hypothetical protein